MSEIKVILTSKQDINLLSKGEKDILFDKLLENNPLLSRNTIDDFLFMHNNTVDFVKPTILELLIRKLISISDNFILLVSTADEVNSIPIKVNVNTEYIKNSINTIAISSEVIKCSSIQYNPSLSINLDQYILLGTYTPVSIFNSNKLLQPVINFPFKQLDLVGKTQESIILSIGNIFDTVVNVKRFILFENQLLVYSQISTITGSIDLLNNLFTSEHSEIIMSHKLTKSTGILKLLESLRPIKFDETYATNVLFDINNLEFYTMYNKALLLGQEFIQHDTLKYTEQQKRIKFQELVIKSKYIERYNVNIYKIIIEKKFGQKVIKEIEHKLKIKPINIAADILQFLKPVDRKPVELEFNKRIQYIQEMLTNKCIHIKLYKKFRRNTTESIYSELKGLFKQKSDQMIICKLCNFEIMCSHVSILASLNLKNASQKDIRDSMNKYMDRVKGNAYCNVCGELIMSNIFTEGLTMAEFKMDDDLKNFIWGEVNMLVKYLKFDAVINISHLITGTRDSLYPFIFEIEKQLLKSKTNTIDEIKAKKKIFITIYAFAYFIKLVISKKTGVTFKNLTTSSKTELVDTIKHCLNLIVVSKNIIIREIPGMSNDVIRTTLVEAYKSITNVIVPDIINADSDILFTLLLDPVFMYYYKINTLERVSSGKAILSPIKSIDEVLGIKLNKSQTVVDIFEKLKLPKLNPTDNYSKYMYSSFLFFDKIIRDKVFIKPVYISAVTNSYGDYSSKFTKEFEEYRILYLNLMKTERAVFFSLQLGSSHAYIMPPIGNTRQWIQVETLMSRIYDERGNLHDWTIYINKKDEYTNKDNISKLNGGKNPIVLFTDKKCSICNVKWSETSKLNEVTIKESLDRKRLIGNFFRFYENRCPKGQLHEFENNIKCKKCGYSAHFVGTTEGESFFDKYKSNYLKDKLESSRELLVPTVPVYKYLYINEIKTWTFNYNIILELADKLKINSRLISALGSYEKQHYSDIESGAYIPPEIDEKYATRLYSINADIKLLFTEYNMIKYYHRLIKPPGYLVSVLDTAKVDKYSTQSLQLPEIFLDHNEKFKTAQLIKKPRETLSYCLQSFCEKCLIIWNDTTESTQLLRHTFVEYIVKKIIRFDELVSTPGKFNWSLLFGTKDEKEHHAEDTANANRRLDDTHESEDSVEPMGIEAFDLENDPDEQHNEDDESDLVGWKIGEL